MLGLAMVLVLASHGGEGSREQKFQGALVPVDRAATVRELNTLLLNRPDFMPSGIAMGIGGGFAVSGMVCLTLASAAGGTNLFLLIVGGIALPAGLIVALVAGFTMIMVVVDRNVIDARIRALKARLDEPLEAPVPAPSVAAPSPLLLLARF